MSEEHMQSSPNFMDLVAENNRVAGVEECDEPLTGNTPFPDDEIKEFTEGVKKFKPWKSFMFYVIAILIFFLILNTFIFNAVIPSSSMERTINPNDRVIGLKSAYWFSDVEREDIVIFNSAEEGRYLVKRVIGLPGDEIEINGGCVYVNGEKLNEDYLKQQDVTDSGTIKEPFTVPDDCYFMLGDNRLNSLDARYWENKFITKKDIIAKVIFRYYPFDSIGKVGD